MSTRVLVVDDTVLFRRVISDALSGIDNVEVAGSASNGKLALSRLRTLSPDVMTLDMEMPEMNGLEVLEAMKASGSQTGVIVLSSHTVRGGALTIRALELGAFDFVTKPEGGSAQENMMQLRNRMQPILRAFERRKEIRSILSGTAAKPAIAASVPEASPPPRSTRRIVAPFVLIGVSTGGPAALAEILPSIPADFKAPIFIVQHMPPLFTKPLAQSLQLKCAIRVKEASDGEIAENGCAYIAPGGRHMKLAPVPPGGILISLSDDPPENNSRPSVDCLFRSAAFHFPGRSIAAILTGMGNDGAHGFKLLKRGGCYTIAQDEATCIVFGMPREAILTGAVDTVAPLSKIAATIIRAVNEAIL